MDTFLDTSILFNDPFWKNTYNKVILDRAKKGKIKLYISSVVLKELRKNFEKNLDEQLKKINNASKEIEEKYSVNSRKFSQPNRDDLITEFKNFYNDLIEKQFVTVIEPENDFLPEIIERAVWRRKPFTESKTELKDTIIWLSYCKYVRDNKIESPYFLTNNTSDFAKQSTKDEILVDVHEDLEKDSDKFKILKSSKDFVGELIEKTEQLNKTNFKKNIQDLNITEYYVRNILEEKFDTFIESKVERELEDQDMTDFFPSNFRITGYFDTAVTDWGDCENITLNILEDSCIITGTLFLFCLVEAYDYVSVRDKGEDRHKFVAEADCTVKVSFSLTIDADLHPIMLDIDLIDLFKEGE